MKIPSQAKKVFSGVIFDVFQWEQELFDGTHATFEMVKRPNTVSVIPTRGDKIIVARELQPTKDVDYNLMGGRQELNETPEEGAKRELLEESGLESRDWEFYKSFSPVHKMDWTIYYYIARDCQKIKEPALEPGEKIELIELSFEEFVDKIMSDRFLGQDLKLHIAQLKLNNQLDQFKNFLFKNEPFPAR